MARPTDPATIARDLEEDCTVLAFYWRECKSPEAKEAIQRLADILINWKMILEE